MNFFLRKQQTANSKLFLLFCLVMFGSCASYRQQSANYYAHLQKGDFVQAEKVLDKNKLLKKDRNQLLLLLEKGKLAHLQGKWEESNRYFNEADGMMEVERNSIKDVALGTFLNPMMKNYRSEDFEKYLVHYYKAVNYLQLGNTEEAMVEARRISLRTYMQEDKAGAKDKYAEDAFAFSLQGMIYEAANDFNNAFIAYRNAVNLYLESKGNFYGTPLPLQLKKDLVRLAHLNGFADEQRRYEEMLGVQLSPEEININGELILFWETGSAPVKVQEDIFFSLVKGAGGALFFTDSRGMYNVPFDMSSGYNTGNIKMTDLRSFRVAFPKYEPQPNPYTHAVVKANGHTIALEKAEDVNTLAVATLKERTLRELSSTLTRLAIKKLSEAAVRGSGSKKDDKEMSEDEKKKEKKKENQREALALGLQIFNFATEKADTRNWQSLPHSIYYARVPLQKGSNELQVTLQGMSSQTIKLNVEGNRGLQFKNITSF